MKREVLKEFDRKYLGVDIVLYSIFVAVGFIILNIDTQELFNIVECTFTLFYIFGFFALFAYFINRVEDDYEFLIFGFINVCVATFIMIYSTYPNTGFILADAVLIYSIANVINKGYHCKRLLEKRDINFFPKVSITAFLLFLGVFVVLSLYSKVQVGSIILGYYFIIFGLLSLLEPLVCILTKNAKFEQYVLNMLAYDENKKTTHVKEEKHEEVKKEKEEVKEEKKPTKKKPVKKQTTKKPVKKTTTKKTKKTTK